MAKVRDRHVGTVQGALGDQVFKVVNGKSYVAEMPHSSKKEPSEAMKNHRAQFGLTMRFSKAVYEQIMLRPFWKAFNPEGTHKVLTTPMKIAKANYHFVTPTTITDLAQLVPDFGFPVVPSATVISNSTISVTIDALGNSGIIDTTVEKHIYLIAVTHISTPVNDGYPANRLLSLKSPQLALNITTELNFVITLDGAMSQAFGAYTTKKPFFVLVTTDTNDVPVHFSSTFLSA
jgi:hypothetical protein